MLSLFTIIFLNVHGSFISNCQKLKTTPTSFSGWVVKQPVAHPHHEMLLRNKKEQTIDIYNNLDGFQGNYAKWKKLISKGYILYGSIYKMVLKWQH